MGRRITHLMLAAAFALCLPAAVQAGPGSMGKGSATHAAPPAGTVMRTAKVLGHELTYRLYGWEDRNRMMAGMQGMPGMDSTGTATHHLMVFVKGPGGKEVAGAKVGYRIVGPDQAEAKTLTMGMYGGYGADVNFGKSGEYAVRTKIISGGTVLEEDFTHVVP